MDRQNLDTYYKDNVGLVHSVARKGHRRLQAIGSSLEYNDLVQDLSVVFIRSFELFDPSKGKFSTYFIQASYHELNKIAREVEEERIENNVKSVEEMDARHVEVVPSEVGTGSSYWLDGQMACSRDTPEQAVAGSMLIANVRRDLTPLARLMADWVIEPPAAVESELEARQAHMEVARSLGHARRCCDSMNLKFICEMLALTGEFTKSEIRAAQSELKCAVERVTA
jgi:hypothetical protein